MMRITSCALAVCLFLLSTTAAMAGNRALLIGVGDYQLDDINDLPGINKDVRMMHEAALDLGFRSNEIKVLLNEEATFRNIQKAIDEWLVDGVGKNDAVLFYFSGHGSQIYDRNKDEHDKVDEVLLCYDTGPAPNSLKNVIVDDMVHDMLKRIRSENVLIFIDACHSGTATRGGDATATGLYPKLYEYPGMPHATRSASFVGKTVQEVGQSNYSALSAAQDNQYAMATEQGSLFTVGVRKAIAGAKKKGAPISMRQLHDEATAHIASVSTPSRVHNPALVGDPSLNSRDIFIKDKPTAQPSNWTSEIQGVIDLAAFPVEVKTNGTVFHRGEQLHIACSFDEPGYVNIITLQDGDQNPTVLFPNRFKQNNRVAGHTTIRIPDSGDSFELTAVPPAGKALIAVFLTPHPVDFYQDGYGKGAFKTLHRSSTRGIAVVARPPASEASQAEGQSEGEVERFGAGIVFVDIK